MDQLVPDLLFSSTLTTEETYSSIDDSPQPLDSDDTFLPNRFAECNSQLLNQSLKFHLGTAGCSQDVFKSLPHQIPILSTSKESEYVHQGSSQEQSDQLVPEISSKEYVHPAPSSFNAWDSTDLRLNYPNRLCFDVSHYTKDYNSLYQWLPTKLPPDESKAINKALLCFSQCCPDQVCKKGKDLLEKLKKYIQEFKVIDRKERMLLEFLLQHREHCTEYFCIAPGCNQSVSSLAELIECIKEENSNELQYSNEAMFYMFSKDSWVNSPKDVNEMTMYCFTSPNSISVYRKDNTWSKITVLGEMMQEVLPLLIKIGRLSYHPNVLPIQWLIDNTSISYSTEHYTEPLKYKFSLMNLNKKDIILQLIDAALHLNYNKIAFLAWTSENVCYKNGRVMLTNFHMGSALFNDFDSGLIKCLLLPTIVPPELNSNAITLEKADVWGVCCLLYELLTYKVVHSHLLHMERDHVWTMLDKNGWKPNCPFSDKSLQSIFHQGWEQEPEHRISLFRLKCEISNSTFSSNVYT